MILIDTHIWIDWILRGGENTPNAIISSIESSEYVAISAISCFEVTLLARKHAIELDLPVSDWILEATDNSGILCLPITCKVANFSAELPDIHRDPADRIIIATALLNDLRLASLDSVFPSYPGISERLLGMRS